MLALFIYLCVHVCVSQHRAGGGEILGCTCVGIINVDGEVTE